MSAVPLFVLAIAGCASSTAPGAQSTAPNAQSIGPGTVPATANTQQAAPADNALAIVSVLLTNFAFTPSRITLRAGIPVRLRLVNQSDGGHDFSAPQFFAKSSLGAGSKATADGGIEVSSHQTVEITLTPLVAGTYPVECTHFLHSVFGMTATIEVVS